MSEQTNTTAPVNNAQQATTPDVKPEIKTSVAINEEGDFRAEATTASPSDAELKAQETQEAPKQEEAPKEEPKQEDEKPASDYGNLPPELHKFQDSYQKNGKLTEADYAELQKIGIPKTVADEHIAMRQRLMQLEQETAKRTVEEQDNILLQEVGGKDTFEQARKWAAENMSAEDKLAFNKLISGNDLSSKKIAMRGLMAQYQQANPKTPQLVTGATSTGNSVLPYDSQAQWVSDMRNPKYKTDPAFRNKVERRLAVSKI